MPFERMVNLSDPDVNAMVRDAIRREEGECIVSVKEPTRTQRQNRHYWKCVVEPLAEALTEASREERVTYSKDDVHYYLKKQWLPPVERVDPITGEVTLDVQSTTKLSKSDFALLTEKGLLLLAQYQQRPRNRKVG